MAELTELKARHNAVEAMSQAAIAHALEEIQTLQRMLTEQAQAQADGEEAVGETDGMPLTAISGEPNQMDVVYDALAEASRQEGKGCMPPWIPVEEVLQLSGMADHEFMQWLQVWTKIPGGILQQTCIALSEYPPEFVHEC